MSTRGPQFSVCRGSYHICVYQVIGSFFGRSICQSICKYIYDCLYVCLSLCLPVCLPKRLYICDLSGL